MHKYFLVLELNPNQQYSNDEIKAQWRTLCLKHHPDRGGDSKKFNEITHAYNMLTDPSYRHTQEKNNLNLNINFQVPVDFEDAFFGRMVTVCYNKFEVNEESKLVIKQEQELHTFIFSYPPGHMGGHQMDISGGGLKYKDSYGNATISFVVKQHNRYQCDGINIITPEQIDLETMIRGGVMEIQTLYGIKTLKIPPGTGPGHKLIISNCGVLRQGAHIVDPHPIYPTKEDLKLKKKFNKLDIDWQDGQEQRKAPVSGVYLGVNI